MKQKNAPPTKEQAEILRKRGYDPLRYVVTKELPYSLMVKNRETGEFDIVKK